MSSLFQEKKVTFFFFLALLFILLVVLNFAFLRPLTKEYKSAENSVQSLKAEIESLREQLNEEPEEVDMNKFHLEKKIPFTRKMEELLLSLQEIELVSGSRIESIQFEYEREIKEEESEDDDKSKEDEQSEEKKATEETNKMEIPENLKPVTASLIVFSPDYDSFMEFMREIEQLERITFVEKLEFVKPAESALLFAEPFNTIPFNLQVTTFYYEQ